MFEITETMNAEEYLLGERERTELGEDAIQLAVAHRASATVENGNGHEKINDGPCRARDLPEKSPKSEDRSGHDENMASCKAKVLLYKTSKNPTSSCVV